MTTAELPRYQHVIDGRRVEAASGQRYDSVDPYLGQPWASAANGDAADVDLAVAAARRALDGPWGQLTGFGRAALMRRLGELIARDAGRLAEIETRDTGKLLREMRGQLGTIPQWFSYFSGLADKLEGTTIPGDKPNFLVYTRREPAGVVAAIVPWNSPLLLLCWKLAPALAAGCTMVAKPSDYSPASAVELAALMEEAGFPPGVFNVVTGFGPAVGQALAAHPGIDKIAFTGSTAVCAQVAAAAAANITGVLLELGGKSAHLVFDDADLDAACNGVLAGVFAATGQTCMAGSRLLVSRTVHDQLVQKITERARSIRLGDPKAPDTEMGPVATEPQYRKVLSFLDGAATEGATVAAGGRPDDGLGGFFVQPTVLTGVKPTMTVACEEVFGPVLSVIPFDTEDEAIAVANDSRYGLAGAVWTKDIHRGHRVAHAMRTGNVGGHRSGTALRDSPPRRGHLLLRQGDRDLLPCHTTYHTVGGPPAKLSSGPTPWPKAMANSYGHPRDRRPDLLQIQAGIAASGDGGIPVYHRPCNGGAAEISQVTGAMTAPKKIAGTRMFLFLHGNRRIAALTTVISLALLVFCLIERQARRNPAPDTKIDGLYNRQPARPTGRLILTILASLRLNPATTTTPAQITRPDTVQARLLELLGVDPTRPP